jgi:hypothetical protein
MKSGHRCLLCAFRDNNFALRAENDSQRGGVAERRLSGRAKAKMPSGEMHLCSGVLLAVKLRQGSDGSVETLHESSNA